MHSGPQSHPPGSGDPGISFHGCFKAQSPQPVPQFIYLFLIYFWCCPLGEKSFLLVYFINQSVLTEPVSECVGSLINQSHFFCLVVFFASSIRLFALFSASCLCLVSLFLQEERKTICGNFYSKKERLDHFLCAKILRLKRCMEYNTFSREANAHALQPPFLLKLLQTLIEKG